MNVISMHFLPGEEPVNTKSIADGILTLTNYRLIFSTKRPQSSWSIPTTLVWKAEAFEMIHIKIITKIGISVTWSFVDEIACDAGYAHITSLIDTPKDIDSLFACKFRSSLEANIPNHPFLLSACELLQINDVDRTLDTALVCFEFRRMNFDKTWKITDINNEFKICSTYPRHHIVPRSISDNDIINMASFRSHNRFLTVVWRSQVTGAVLLRCAQPCVGLMCSRNEYDEKFLRTVLACCPKKPVSDPNKDTHRLMIVDARSRSSAQFNRIRGGGFEYPEYYDQAEVVFMDLPNLHTVRSNFESLTNLFAGKCPNWFSSLEKSSWLNNIGQLLKTATEIAIALEENSRPVMVHCTDGWDRTPQISSLAQLLADPFYRTIQGFNILVEREWLQFGHKFSDRSGHASPSLNINEQSPIFLQWLDCVHQIRNQFPHCFEFNESFLLKLGLHICSNLFGTFLCNSEKERQKASVASRTCSLWGLLSSKYNWTIVNYFYEPEAEHLLQPDCQVRSLSLWSAFYGIALSTSKVNPTLDIPEDVIEATPNNAHSVTNSAISSTKHKSLSSIDPAPNKTNSTSNINYEKWSQPTTNLLGDDHPSDSIKITVPNLKIDTSEEVNSDGNLFIKGYASNRNSHRRSLDDINNYMDSRSNKQQSREFSLSNRVSPTIMKSSSQCFFEDNVCNEKNSPGPAILRLSSLSDDTGICSGLSKSHIRSLSSLINGSYPFPKHSDKCISPESGPAQLTSLPENDEVLVNGAVSLTSDSDDSPNECNDLNFSTPLGESLSGQLLSTNKTEISVFGHNGSEKFQDITGTISKVIEENLDEAFVTKLSELLIPEDLLAWRNKYFRLEYFPNMLSQSSSSVSCGSRNSSSSQMFDCSSNYNSKALKPGGSFDSKSHSVTVNPKISLPEFTRITTNDDVYNRPTSAPISPTSAVSYFPSTLHKNSTPLNREVHNPSIDQNISNGTNALEEIQKKPLSSTLMNTLSWFPDWDGLPMLVDRLTIHAHSQLCQERYNRKTQKQSMLALEAKLKYAQLEVERLNSEARRLKQLLELTKTETCKQDTNVLASSDDHLSSLSSSLSSYEQKFTQNSHINSQCKSKESSLLSSELFVSISKDKNISEEHHNPSNIKSELTDPIESVPCKTTSFELIDTEDGQSVLLQPDCIAHQCTSCRIEFSALRPKHHCRNCGYIFCTNCSDRRIVTTSQPSEPVRVCRHCFFQLSRPTAKSSKQQLVEEYTPCVARHTIMKEDNNGGGLVKNFTNPDFLSYMNNSVMLSTGSDSGCMPVSSFPNCAVLRMSSSGVSHHFNDSFNSETTTNNATTTAAVNHRLDSILTNNPPLSRCHSAGGTRPTSSAASDGIAQA
ncbi:unnamed protein product [Schistosoma margrebowiei]|uniref:phosphatidylinositol-3,5-bisphosphate 3-phosphatase n=1 Tax=Schistosoma margrebowiei TaxID=48269 RepID=A0AA85A457_9TREM|nr:unnamed protein product [Schistosoma margrebowiei]